LRQHEGRRKRNTLEIGGRKTASSRPFPIERSRFWKRGEFRARGKKGKRSYTKEKKG